MLVFFFSLSVVLNTRTEISTTSYLSVLCTSSILENLSLQLYDTQYIVSFEDTVVKINVYTVQSEIISGIPGAYFVSMFYTPERVTL